MNIRLPLIIIFSIILSILIIPQVEASDTQYEFNSVTNNYDAVIYGSLWKTETFTIGSVGENVDHYITSVKLMMKRIGDPGDVTVSIRATDVTGKPTGPDLVSNTTNGSTLSTTNEWREIFLQPYKLLSGTKYAIVVRATTGNSGNEVRWNGRGADDYAGGEAFGSVNSGAYWGTEFLTNLDLAFYEYGITAPGYPENFNSVVTGSPLSKDIVLTWIKGNNANNTYIVKKAGSYPSDRSDGTNIYNGTGTTYTDVTPTPGNIYYYRAWSCREGDSSHIWSESYSSTTTSLIGNNHTIIIRYEHDNSLVNVSHYNLLLTYYFDDGIYYNDSITSNEINITFYSVLKLIRLTVNGTYYRSRIPESSTGNITFYIVKNTTDISQYLFSLDDQSGLYAPPDAYLQIYTYYNETQQIIHEEYFAADLGVAAYLRYIPPYTRYYAQVISGSDTYGPLVINTNTTTTQSIVVYPEGLSDQYIFSNYITFTGYISGTSLYANYTDSLSGTNAVNLTFIEWYNNSETIIGYYNTTSDDFQKYFSINTSRTHFIDIAINHDDLGNLTARLYFYHSPTQITNQTSIEDKLTAVFGDNPLGWGNMIAFVLSIIVLMTFGQADAGLGILGMAMTLGFLNIFLGFSVIVIGICVLLGMMGVLVLVRDKGGLT